MTNLQSLIEDFNELQALYKLKKRTIRQLEGSVSAVGARSEEINDVL
ncbi:hypothetical protein ACFQDF_17875 [Ectobacillus funiculus]